MIQCPLCYVGDIYQILLNCYSLLRVGYFWCVQSSLFIFELPLLFFNLICHSLWTDKNQPFYLKIVCICAVIQDFITRLTIILPPQLMFQQSTRYVYTIYIYIYIYIFKSQLTSFFTFKTNKFTL